jgi:hypothetical protein
MPYSNIDKSSKYFNTKLYTGNGSTTQSITGVGFQPDFSWVKNRSNGTAWNRLVDVIRGATKTLYSNSTNAESTTDSNGYIASFDSDGLTVNLGSSGTGTGTNSSGDNFVTWNWLASNTTVSNTSGTISSTVSANTTSGFSIVSWTGNSSAGSTIGHGLGVAPAMIITKVRSRADNWVVYHKSLPVTEYIMLNLSSASQTDNEVVYYDTRPTSSVFTVGANGIINGSTHTYIAYCFAEVKGFSKFGSYTGNGSTNGTFVYTGFTPAFVLVKNTTQASSWILFDNKRSSSGGSNAIGYSLKPNVSNSEDTGAGNILDFVSNGFKIRSDGVYEDTNGSGQSIIYMAFASNPFVSSKGIAVTAR